MPGMYQVGISTIVLSTFWTKAASTECPYKIKNDFNTNNDDRNSILWVTSVRTSNKCGQCDTFTRNNILWSCLPDFRDFFLTTETLCVRLHTLYSYLMWLNEKKTLHSACPSVSACLYLFWCAVVFSCNSKIVFACVFSPICSRLSSDDEFCLAVHRAHLMKTT